MTDVIKKLCAQCGQPDKTYGVDKSKPDGFRLTCKDCRRAAAAIQRSAEERELKLHNKIVKNAKDRLAHPETLTSGELKKMADIVRLDDEHKAKLQKKAAKQRQAVENQRRVEVAAQNAVAGAPLLEQIVERCGLPLCLTAAELRVWLEKARAVLAESPEPKDGAAVQYIEAYLEPIAQAVADDDKIQAELAHDAHELLNDKVSNRVIGRVHDEFLPLIRAAHTAEAKIALREKIRARKKLLVAMAKTATDKDKSGADKAVVAKRVADAMEKLAMMLYHGTKAPLPTDTLVNLQSRIDSGHAMQEEFERAEAERRAYWDDLRDNDPEQFEKESKSLVRQIKGDDYWAQQQRVAARKRMREDPIEAARIALLALQPRNVALPNIVYVVPDGRREIWYWPDGRLVQRGKEVTYDARLKKYCLMPGPAGIEMDAVTPPGRQKMEGYYDEMDCDAEGYPKWKYRPEGSVVASEQLNDGTWRKVGGQSPWTKPEKIEFRKAPQRVEGSGKDNFRHGEWWSDDDVQQAAAADAANPSGILPPLPRYSVADSIALPPPISASDRAKDAKPLETVWQRSARLRREQAEREAALLRGESVAV